MESSNVKTYIDLKGNDPESLVDCSSGYGTCHLLYGMCSQEVKSSINEQEIQPMDHVEYHTRAYFATFEKENTIFAGCRKANVTASATQT